MAGQTAQILRQLTFGGQTFGDSLTVDGTVSVLVNEDFADDATDAELAVALDVSTLATGALFLYATADVKVEINDGTTPDNTFDLAAGVLFAWDPSQGDLTDTEDAAVTEDWVSIFLTQLDDTAGTLQIWAFTDPA